MTQATTPKVDPQKTRLMREHKHNRPLTTCYWDPNDQFVFFGAEDHLIHRFQVASGQVVTLAAHDSWVRSLGSSPDGKTLYSGGYDGRLAYWPLAADQPKPIRLIDAHEGWIRALTVSSDGRHLATCGNDLVVKVWEAATGNCLHTFSGHKSHVYNVTFSQDGSAVYSCDLKGMVRVASLTTGKSRALVTASALHGYDTTFRADIGGARDLALHGDGDQLALCGISNVTNAFAGVGETVIALVSVKQAKLLRVMRPKKKTKGTMWGVTHHPDGFWIGLSGGSGGGWLSFWKGDSEHEFFGLKLKYDGRGLCVSPDGRRVAVAHADQHLRIYTLHAQA